MKTIIENLCEVYFPSSYNFDLCAYWMSHMDRSFIAKTNKTIHYSFYATNEQIVAYVLDLGLISFV